MATPEEELDALERDGLRRRLRPLESPPGPSVTRGGRRLWNFAANDYLGLAGSAAVRDAFHEGLDRFGHGATASRLVTGSQPPHEAFEEELAAAKSAAAALLFSSGFAAALGIIPALVGKDDTIILDKLCHASLIDGARLSGATLRVFPHNDHARLGELLARTRTKFPDQRILILTESVFSMDGDLCPLREIVDLKDRQGALLLVDEAHGFGVLGPRGMGLAEELGVQDRIEFQFGTLSKAAGLAGAYLATTSAWRELLVNRARSFIYSTAPPPALAHAARRSLGILRSTEGAGLRAALDDRIQRLSPGARSPILPIVLGDNPRALDAAASLEEAGFLVPAIRFPTVPRGTARLRISLSASHPVEAVGELAVALGPLLDPPT